MRIRSIFLMTALVWGGCAAPPKQSNKEQAQARWEQMRAKVKFQLAERHFENGQLDPSMQICEEVLALDPTHLAGYLLMARIRLEKGQAAEAEAALDAAGGLGQPTPEMDYLRGMLAERREQAADAMDWYKRAYEARPNEVEYLLAYVESMLTADAIAPAMELLRQRRDDFEQEIRLQLLLGQSLALLGKHREAGDVYLSVIRLAPTEPMIREEAGLVLLAGGRLREAQVVLEPLLAGENTPSVVVLQTWAKALLDNNEPHRAAAVLEEATARYPGAYAPWLLRAKAQLMLDKPAPARDACRRACELKPDSVEARLLLAYCSLEAGDRDEALVAAQRVIVSRPDDAQAMLILERALKPAQVR